MPTPSPVYRFAPSPNGELHLGHAFSAILNFELAKRSGGQFFLRIEDIDQARSSSENISAIYRDLEWLGLNWIKPVRRQSDHIGTYRAALSKLDALGLLYPCFATRKEILNAVTNQPGTEPTRDPDGALIYPGLYKNINPEDLANRRATGEPFALRLDMQKATALLKTTNQWPPKYVEISADGNPKTLQTDPARWGDVIIARKDLQTSYHLAVTVDDAIQKITHIVRGLDLQPSTDIHRLLQIFLELPAPIYHHHRLINDETQHKLSKSAGSKNLRQLREEGTTPEMIWSQLGFRFPQKTN